MTQRKHRYMIAIVCFFASSMLFASESTSCLERKTKFFYSQCLSERSHSLAARKSCQRFADQKANSGKYCQHQGSFVQIRSSEKAFRQCMSEVGNTPTRKKYCRRLQTNENFAR